jgi:phage tail sheath protein FI
MLFYHRRWMDFTRGLWATPAAKLATVSGVVGIVSAIAAPIKGWLT